MKRFILFALFVMLTVMFLSPSAWAFSVQMGGVIDTCANSKVDSEETQTTGAAIGNGDADRDKVSTEFLTSKAYNLCRIDVNVKLNGALNTTLRCYLYSDSGAHQPNALLATSTSTHATLGLPAAYGTWTQFDFTSYALNNATLYHIVLSVDDVGAGGNYVGWGANSGDNTYYTREHASGSWNTIFQDQACFKTFE